MTTTRPAATNFRAVDDLLDPDRLVDHMDGAAAYPAVTLLRQWSMDRLRLRPGQRVIDVGCGPATETARLAEAVGRLGLAVGVDASQVMIAASRERVPDDAAVDLRVADATALPYAGSSFDAYRSERTYQWLADPDRALTEALRVLRPGGRLAVADTDWGTLTVDHPEPALTTRLLAGPWPIPPNRFSGRRLLTMLRRRGMRELDATAQSILVMSWDPSTAAGPPAMPPPGELAEMATSTGALSPDESDRWLQTLEGEARAGRFFMSVTMFAVAGTKPA